MPNIEGAPRPELAEAPWPFWGLVRGNIEQKGRGTSSHHKQDPQPRPEPNAQLTPRASVGARIGAGAYINREHWSRFQNRGKTLTSQWLRNAGAEPFEPGRRREIVVKERPGERKEETLRGNPKTEEEMRGQQRNTEEDEVGGDKMTTEEEIGIRDGQQGAPKRTELQGE
ncbi:hypothetical protein NDU88_009535 [Pleurodeles waltl]|uniref:Uncharacterized protein n=1 Tax=Pleurodeles waltl TaxID=8319 RepID=A0AAV7RXW5_PLEWA|nr:hypothetical protein NDU88_009535 [Pleurodeles waltl]